MTLSEQINKSRKELHSQRFIQALYLELAPEIVDDVKEKIRDWHTKSQIALLKEVKELAMEDYQKYPEACNYVNALLFKIDNLTTTLNNIINKE